MTGSGQELAIAAESCSGELANFWKGSLRENRCRGFFHGADDGSHLGIGEWQKANIIIFVDLLLYH